MGHQMDELLVGICMQLRFVQDNNLINLKLKYFRLLDTVRPEPARPGLLKQFLSRAFSSLQTEDEKTKLCTNLNI